MQPGSKELFHDLEVALLCCLVLYCISFSCLLVLLVLDLSWKRVSTYVDNKVWSLKVRSDKLESCRLTDFYDICFRNDNLVSRFHSLMYRVECEEKTSKPSFLALLNYISKFMEKHKIRMSMSKKGLRKTLKMKNSEPICQSIIL